MMKMHKYFLGKTVSSSRGFSLLEVLLGITVFMIGMLGVTALNISSLKSSTFAGNMSEAVILAGDKIEELMALDFDDADLDDSPSPNDDGTNQDLLPAGPPPGDGIDDDGGNFGLDDTGTGAGEADHWELGVGKNGMYNVYWNVAVGEPMPDKTKTVNVIVEWFIKDKKRSMNMSTIILDHD
jgi:hypothetical protein